MPEEEQSDYKLDITFWGSGGWVFLKACALMFPKDATPQTRAQYRTFFENVGHVLPCGRCDEHFNTFLRKHPIAEDFDALYLFNWLNALHNEVNVSKGKPAWALLKSLAEFMPPEMAKEMFDLNDEQMTEMTIFDKERGADREADGMLIAVIVLSVVVALLIAVVIAIACCRKR